MELIIYAPNQLEKANHKVNELYTQKYSYLYADDKEDAHYIYLANCVKAVKNDDLSYVIGKIDYSILTDCDAVIDLGKPYVFHSVENLLNARFTIKDKIPQKDLITPNSYISDIFLFISECLNIPFLLVSPEIDKKFKYVKEYYSTEGYRLTSSRSLKKELQKLGLNNSSRILILVSDYTKEHKQHTIQKLNTVVKICKELP